MTRSIAGPRPMRGGSALGGSGFTKQLIRLPGDKLRKKFEIASICGMGLKPDGHADSVQKGKNKMPTEGRPRVSKIEQIWDISGQASRADTLQHPCGPPAHTIGLSG